eukprot:9058331-Alexandrium_andersonii.AAC.1
MCSSAGCAGSRWSTPRRLAWHERVGPVQRRRRGGAVSGRDGGRRSLLRRAERARGRPAGRLGSWWSEAQHPA